MNKWGIQLRGRNYIKVSNGNVRNKFFFSKIAIEMKKTFDRLLRTLDTAKESISKLEDWGQHTKRNTREKVRPKTKQNQKIDEQSI